MKLSIIIPNYNGKVLLEKMLPHLEKALKDQKDSEIIIYDNNSTDESRVFIETKYPNIRLIASSENDGFTKAVNCAALSAKNELLLLLNNDCFINDQTISLMIEFLRKNPGYCMTQPVVLNNKGDIENIGFVVDISRAKARAITDPKDTYIDEEYTRFPNSKGILYGLSATCLLVKRDVFINEGMFDESFHSYLEDVDLAFRLAHSHKKYFPTLNAKCTHEHMATSIKMGSYKQQRDFLNWIRIILKNYSTSLILSHFFPLALERMRNLNGLLKKLVK
jgi:GT2 family glycosyltransferase